MIVNKILVKIVKKDFGDIGNLIVNNDVVVKKENKLAQ